MIFRYARELWANGVVGLNKRNAEYVLPFNERKFYPLVDNKLLTKDLAHKAGIRVPALYGKIEHPHEVDNFRAIVAGHTDFVVKPAQGTGGHGIIVVVGRTGDYFSLADGSALSAEDMNFHINNILAGAFSLAGQPDQVVIEYRVHSDPIFQRIAYKGVPDIRIIVFLGVPVMAMVRLPTRVSRGKANLHQGALGAGIAIPSGRTLAAVWGNSVVTEHPDTKASLINFEIPGWHELLYMAARSYDLTKLGYVGIDFALDENKGPLVLELNARPGLNIQIANGEGLGNRLNLIQAYIKDLPSVTDRVQFALTNFSPKPVSNESF